MVSSFSCNPAKRISASEVNHAVSDVSGSDRYRELYFGIIDSLQNIKAPIEQSSSYGRRHSDLETSLARSSAGIDSLGNLYHDLANKDSIPSKVVYKWRDRIVRDSMYICKSDTLTVWKTVETVKELSGWQHTQIYAGRISTALLMLLSIYLFVRWKKRF